MAGQINRWTDRAIPIYSPKWYT